MVAFRLSVLCWLSVLSFALANINWAAEPIRLERVVSREDAKFDTARSRMTVGRDGRLYFTSGEFLLRMERDGSGRVGARSGTAMTRGTANADGVIGTGHAHFSHALKVWRPDFSAIGEVADFWNNDQVQYFSPTDVQVGSSGDFFGYDSNQNRIVRVSPRGKLLRAYGLIDAGLDTIGKMPRFRVFEPGERFYVRFDKFLFCVRFDGSLIWKQELGPEGNLWDGWQDVFDVDADGQVLVLTRGSDELRVFDQSGTKVESVPLEVGRALLPDGATYDAATGKSAHPPGRLEDLAIWRGEVFVKRTDPTQLCSVFDRATGKFKRSIRANIEFFRATLPNLIWTAGDAVEIDISRGVPGESEAESPAATGSKLAARVWLRPYNTPDFVELPIADGKVRVPVDTSGLYQVRVSPDVRGGTSEYQLDAAVEIRVPNSKGSVSIFTPLNRLYFGRGETIPVTVVTRTKFVEELPRQWQVRLLPLPRGSESRSDSATVPAAGRAVNPLFVQFVLTTPGRLNEFRIPPHITRTIPPGRYVLTVEAPGYTVAAQHVIIGGGIEQPDKFSLVQHGDYTSSFPPSSTNGPPSAFEIPELVAANSVMTRKLSLNLFADRIGVAGAGVKHLVTENVPTDELFERLKSDPQTIAPEKARVENALRQTLAARGAFGQEERGILLMMDAGLPIGTGFDKRTAEQRAADMREVYEALKSYPALRGWSWAANWWLDKTGAEAAKDDEQKTAYRAAIKLAKEKGEWSPVLDEVSDVVFSHAVQAERELRNVQDSLAPGLISAMTGPYRAVYTHPPITFRHADEVDLHYQMEQIQPPGWTAHAVDFLKRPNKRAWGHPEIWNDSGRGEMLFPTILPMAMRGADGIGWSGRPRDWTPSEDDSRAAGPGLLSMLRALNEFWTVYGPWHTTLENRDRVAIVVSTLMQRIGGWHSHLGSEYHERLIEAYNACLYSHRPARFLFVEDLRPESLQHLQAILVVGQTVELDPPMAATLAEAKKAGIKIFADGTCRPELVKDFEPLGVSFDRLNNAGELAQDDSLYVRMPRWFFEHAMELKEKLKEVTPVAICNQPEVLLFERFSGDARFVWAVNNTMLLEQNPGQAWRTGLMMSERAPVIAHLDLRAGADFIYDVMAFRRPRKQADGQFGFGEPLEVGKPFLCDLRSSPMRLYATLPVKPEKIKISIPSPDVRNGSALEWKIDVSDSEGKPINANLPVVVDLRNQEGHRIDAIFTTTQGRDGVSGSYPIRVPAGGARISLTSFELLSPMFGMNATRDADLKHVTQSLSAFEYRFGPHFKDLAISNDERLAVANAMNGHENLFAFELQTGEGAWRQRIGDHLTYSPIAAADTFAVQAFDRRTSEGYQLHLLNHQGECDRRFSLFGLPKRATSWANASHIADRGINSFAVSPDASWVASAGDLGLAVWSRDGTLRWSDDSWKTGRTRRRLAAVDTETLLTLSNGTVTAHRAKSGEKLWDQQVVPAGNLTAVRLNSDGQTLVVTADTDGGRTVVMRDRKVIGTIHGSTDVALPTPDGRFVAVTQERRLKWYSDAGELLWQFTGNEVLRNPTISADGERIAVSSELGTLTLLSRRGEVLAERDLHALATMKFLRDGDLITALWNGDIFRFTGLLVPKWHRHPVPFGVRLRPPGEPKKPGEGPDIPFQTGDLPDNSFWAGWPITINVPTTRMRGWGNAASEPAPLTPNLLTETKAKIEAWSDPPTHGDPREWQNEIELLTDGKPDAPPQPWLTWHDINLIDSGWRNKLTFVADTFREQIKLTGVTFVEDGTHPESWLRDVRLQWWDATDESWRDGPILLWDADADRPEGGPPVSSPHMKRQTPWPTRNEPIAHTHWLEQPIEAAKFRFVSTGGGSWPVGNLRLGELVFHGERLGCSHPDAVLKKPLAVLFDENEAALRDTFKHGHNPQFDFGVDGAFSGGKFLLLKQASTANALFRPPFGHAIPNWNFEIAEKPEPGQYRWLQFAWKATSPDTTGVGLLIGRAYPGGGFGITCGDAKFPDGTVATHHVPGPVPTEWKTVRVDLWSLFSKEPVRIQTLSLLSRGGGTAFDRIVLAASATELDKVDSRTDVGKSP